MSKTLLHLPENKLKSQVLTILCPFSFLLAGILIEVMAEAHTVI
jgi:hypothetical protein